MRIPRTRGAVSGVLLIVVGVWGAMVPFVGHYFDFVIGSDRAWDFTAGRFWLSLLPGAVVALGGLLVLLARSRPTGLLGTWLALVGGAWFVVGEQFSQLWNNGTSQAGEALGGTGRRVAEQLAYFDGLGVLIVAIAAIALGRLTVRSVRDAELAAAETEDESVPDPRRRTRESGRFDRDPEPATTTPGTATSTAQTETLTAADRVRTASDENPGRRGFFKRRR